MADTFYELFAVQTIKSIWQNAQNITRDYIIPNIAYILSGILVLILLSAIGIRYLFFSSHPLPVTLETITTSNADKITEVAKYNNLYFDSVLDVVFSPDGKILASASFKDIITLWNIDNGTALRKIKERTDYDYETVLRE